MAIKINGTTVTTNSINGTSVSRETVNGTTVYSATVSRVWYWYSTESSEPSSIVTPYNTAYGFTGNPSKEELEYIMTDWFPPANISVGTIGWIHDTTLWQWYMLMVIEE